MMHFIFAKVFGIRVKEIKIGADWPQIKIRKCRISPLLGNSFVEVEYNDLNGIAVFKRNMFFLSGIFLNIGLAFIFFFFSIIYHGEFVCTITFIANITIAISNIIPYGKTDIANLIISNREKNNM